MKIRILNLTFILTLIYGISFGQNQASTEFNINHLNGTWKNITEFRSAKLTYAKSHRTEKDYVGLIMEFKADGKVISRHKIKSLRCGNDLRRIPRKGEWYFDRETGILQTNMESQISGGSEIVQSYKILELTNDRLVMKRITE
ncbi:hypothetical protein [Aequorivita vladivostokensis]|uniref:Lipocalin-like domain-containing protein n=1 Tax=Aequorivita vladivostokensis TaxID=171194 RepID=A0ABR5DGC3_9FLAO|nr:hypothetical protein [Aequorivita vladivostokensis]KJJ37840.1 hypothetical protein MB09_12470 [Aequorivita vladivostokensis]|tara:strand:+ start:52 stop:480 length:429 start_codon:yes stop_codon:yes gene_type:complete